MDILVVTTIWSGSKPIFFEGKSDSAGMPAFNKILKKLNRKETSKVNVVLLCNYEQFHKDLFLAPWLNNASVYKFYWNSSSIYSNAVSFIKLFFFTIKKIEKLHISLVYLHGTLGFPSYLAARIKRTPTGQRIYGTFLEKFISNNGVLKAFIKSPFESAAFRLKKDFLLVTDDGTKGDLVVHYFNKRKIPYDFYFLQNGVDTNVKNMFSMEDSDKNIFYPARIAKWKRQDLAIDFLFGLHNKEIKLYFAGQVTDKDYYSALISKIEMLGLNDRVVFLGEVSHNEIQSFMSKCFAVAAFYDVSCKGNVALEAIAGKCLFVSLQDRGLDSLIENNISGILGNSIDDCCNKVNDILDNPSTFQEIKANMTETSIVSWEERLEMEYRILSSASKKGVES